MKTTTKSWVEMQLFSTKFCFLSVMKSITALQQWSWKTVSMWRVDRPRSINISQDYATSQQDDKWLLNILKRVLSRTDSFVVHIDFLGAVVMGVPEVKTQRFRHMFFVSDHLRHLWLRLLTYCFRHLVRYLWIHLTEVSWRGRVAPWYGLVATSQECAHIIFTPWSRMFHYFCG